MVNTPSYYSTSVFWIWQYIYLCQCVVYFHVFYVINYHFFISTWRTMIISYKIGLVVMNSLSFCLPQSFIFHSPLRNNLQEWVFLMGFSFLSVLWVCNTVPWPIIFCSEIQWQSNGSSFVHYNLLLLLLIAFLFLKLLF